ncbi:response regulator [Oceanobacillus massiliensis]|uniref:response regulator n=1 Tax=Oceanobacillus massiliensis TaxID=1465765 RepID=UPI000287F6A9|nr:response regulator transcription factor [Oceanobacillus massiliensis]
MIRTVVIDDHEIVRKGIIAYLQTEDDIDIIGQAASGNEGAELVLELRPDVVLMDLIMDNGNGIEATKRIMEKHAACKIIILTSFYDDEQIFPAIQAGAFSYILKTSSAPEIAETIKKAARNENVIEPKVAGKMMSNYRSEQNKLHDDLTERELEVLLCIGNGMTNQEISDQLYIGIKTVKTHVSNILSKLNVKDRTQAAVYVHRKHLL